jgi:hypothetical protein
MPLPPLGSGEKKFPVLATDVARAGSGLEEKPPMEREEWVEKGGGIRWRPSFKNTHSTGLLSTNLPRSRLLFVKIPPSFAKGRGPGG